jgi:hypothetical protein
MLSNLGFAVDMEVSVNGESLLLRGDDERLVVSFVSVGAARRILPLLRHDSFKAAFSAGRLQAETLIETRISGRIVALSGGNIKSGIIGRILGLQGTRLFLVNLLRSIITPG